MLEPVLSRKEYVIFTENMTDLDGNAGNGEKGPNMYAAVGREKHFAVVEVCKFLKDRLPNDTQNIDDGRLSMFAERIIFAKALSRLFRHLEQNPTLIPKHDKYTAYHGAVGGSGVYDMINKDYEEPFSLVSLYAKFKNIRLENSELRIENLFPWDPQFQENQNEHPTPSEKFVSDIIENDILPRLKK